MARVLGSDSVHDQERSSLPAAGTVLDQRFELLELVGAGGMGAVYRARDRTDGRVIALKLLAIDEATCLRRFRREFRAASRLGHPNVIAVHSYHPSERPFFTMEFVPGATLERWVGVADGAALNAPERVARIRSAMRQLLEAASYIHGCDLVHRDLKPENVLVTPDGQLKVMDFGVVRGGASSGGITQGRIVGTLTYMAPEQLEGRPVDARSDLYSIGAILYELLTGEPPFEDSQFGSLARAILGEVPPWPASLNPGVDAVLAGLAVTLLAKKPWQRFASAAEALAVLEARWDRHDPRPSRPLLLAPQFAGRDAETARAREALDALAGGHSGFLIVSGAAGLGKTRFLEEIAAIARGGGRRTYGAAAAPGDGRAYGALEPLLRMLIGDARSLGTNPIEVAELEAMLIARDLGDATSERARAAGARAFARLLIRLAEADGLVLLLDDIDAFDAASVELIQNLAREVVAPGVADEAGIARIIVVCSHTESRPERSVPLARLGDLLSRLRIATSFCLQPLAREETEAVIRAILGETEVPAALARWVHGETEGNPYFVVETVRHLVEEGFVVRAAGRLGLDWERVGLPPREELEVRDFEGLPLPRGVRALVERLLGRLGAREREVLASAAVAGPEFEFDTLLAVSGLDEDALIDVLQLAIAARLVAEVRERRDTFRFVHAKAREVLLAGLPAVDRAARHAGLARAIERRGTAGDVVALARHLDAAGLVEEAVLYLPGAAEKLALSLAHGEAAEAWSRYLDLAPPDTPERARARRMLAGELLKAGRLNEAKLVLEDLAAPAGTASGADQAEVLESLAQLESRLGNFAQAIVRGCEMLAQARAGGDARAQARALLVLGQAQAQHGQLGDAERSLEEAARLHRAGGDALGLAAAMWVRGTVSRELGRFAEATELVQSALAQFRVFGARRQEQGAVLELGRIEIDRGRIERALECFREAMAMAEAERDAEGVAIANNSLGAALTMAGDHGEAERCLARCLRHTADGCNSGLEAVALGNRAQLRRFAGDLDGALADVHRAAGVLHGVVPVGLRIAFALEQTRIEAALGHFAAARRTARQALALARKNRLAAAEARVRTELAEVLRGPAALREARGALRVAERMGAELLQAQALARIARLEEEAGRPTEVTAARGAALRILRGIARRLGAGERMFLRTPLCRGVIQAQTTVVDRGLGARATTRR